MGKFTGMFDKFKTLDWVGLALVGLYILSPLDLIPLNPIDDLGVLLGFLGYEKFVAGNL